MVDSANAEWFIFFCVPSGGYLARRFAPLAQLAEQLTLNQ